MSKYHDDDGYDNIDQAHYNNDYLHDYDHPGHTTLATDTTQQHSRRVAARHIPAAK
jgi:hypothetical protein